MVSYSSLVNALKDLIVSCISVKFHVIIWRAYADHPYLAADVNLHCVQWPWKGTARDPVFRSHSPISYLVTV